jgi:ADP-dependent NAD(P)H-hydrate dehydratase / NAD(P)H-hydrate epimerase
MPLAVLSIAQMREWEKATWATGQTEIEVIRRVGKALAQYAKRLTAPGDLILILAGKGNNGEDARCAREHLTDRRVDILDIKDPAADLSKLDLSLSLRPALVIDALFGIGLSRPLDQDWITLVERVNAARTQVLAVDVPSGLNGDSGEHQGAAIEAALTVTVGAPKRGLLQPAAWPFVGRLEVAAEVGLIPCPDVSDNQAGWTLAEDFARFPRRRAASAHKGTYGHLAILAGSVGYHGAAVLAATGAQRAQPGLIAVHTQSGAYQAIASQLQAVMVSPWRTEASLSGASTALLIGPGLAAADLPEEIKDFTRRQWSKAPVPVVVDASALDWLPQAALPHNAVRVITPHPGEAGRMLGSSAKEVQNNRLDALRELSRRFGDTWVVLKGHQTLVGRSTGQIFVNCSGNPYLAQGGSGDVLAGFVGGLLAQPQLQTEVLKTLRYAVWQHGAAADWLQAARRAWTVENLVEELGQR